MSFPCVGPDLIDISSVGLKGRCCNAVKSIAKGSVVTSNTAYCWVLRSDFIDTHCSNCLKSSSTLKQCTICKAVQYCGKNCQTNDWPQHKHECKHIAGVLSKLTDQDFDDAKVLVRTILSAKKSKSDVHRCSIESDTVSCSKEHVNKLSVPSVCYDESLLALLSIVCSITRQSMETVAQLLFQFRSNNFGITNELMTCIAAGVFPHAAILNHSCNPNCVLRYSLTSTGPVLHIVALRDITAGDELTHSYVDCTQPRVMRQLTLTEHYDFTCDCSLCSVSRNRSSGGLSLRDELHQFHRGDSGAENDPLAIKKFLSSLRRPPTNPLGCDSLMTEIKVSTEEFVSITEEVESLVTRAQEADLLSGSVDDNSSDSTALTLLEAALARLQPTCGPFNFELYKLRGRLMTQYLLTGSSALAAFAQFRCMVAYLTIALSHLPSHPLLGLQLFTLGDIARDVGELQYACEVYEWAASILRVSHGVESEMLKRLKMSILEVRSELLAVS